MSLFPAYSGDKHSTEDNEENKIETPASKTGNSWLVNPSFSVEVASIPLPNEPPPPSQDPLKLESVRKKNEVVYEISDDEQRKKKTSKKKKKSRNDHKHKRKKDEKKESVADEKDFFEDKMAQRGNLTVSTLSRPAVPLYRFIPCCLLGQAHRTRSRKRKRFRRYFNALQENVEENVASNSKKAEPKDHKIEDGEGTWSMHMEEELAKSTEQFNKSIAENPKNIEMWLKYVAHQDLVWQFEKTYRKGSGVKGALVTAERKLAILDKALQQNPDSEKLLQEQLIIASQIYPADTQAKRIEEMLEKQPGKLVLWRALLATKQSSLASSSVPAATKLYTVATTRLHQLRRGTLASVTEPTERKIIAMLHDCSLFLRQAGLWELLWMLLKLYLELTLAQPDSAHFQFSVQIPEKSLIEAEEQVLQSQLPISELWLRIERLREGVHWLPISSESESSNDADPQRLVFPYDVSDLLHPITTPELGPVLAATVITLLKVPLLPSRHTAVEFLGLHEVSWAVDDVETLLPALFSVGVMEATEPGMLVCVAWLTTGPQYLSQRLGQEQFIEFVLQVLRACADCLEGSNRIAFSVWWLRFMRLLIILDRLGCSKLPQGHKKKFKSMVKDFLKKEQNRNEPLYYREYALLEWDMGNHEAACGILSTLLSAQSIPVMNSANENERAGLCCVYRTLFELHMRIARQGGDPVHRKKALCVLISVALGGNSEESRLPDALQKFRHITAEFLVELGKQSAVTVSNLILPDFYVDWISCHAWLIFMSESVDAAKMVLENALSKLPIKDSSSSARGSCMREGLMETLVDMLYFHCTESPGSYLKLHSTLHLALKEFPSNLQFLNIAVTVQAGVGGTGCPWWKLSQYFLEVNSILARLVLVLAGLYRKAQMDALSQLTHSFLHTGGPMVLDRSPRNQLQALFSHLETNPSTRNCPLVWRLRLQFQHEDQWAGDSRSLFYRAVENCSWVKALYMDAVSLIPGELPQVQDLMIEKELRLHVTPEELDILRSA